ELEAVGQLMRGQVLVVLGSASGQQILLVDVMKLLNQSAVSIAKPEQVLDDNFFGRRVDRQLEIIAIRLRRTRRLHLINTGLYGVGMLPDASGGRRRALLDGRHGYAGRDSSLFEQITLVDARLRVC